MEKNITLGLSQFENKLRQKQYDLVYLKMAEQIGMLSYCKRKQVGCLIVKDDNILSSGFNGSPKGMDNFCEDESGETLWYVLHAESNAISKLARSTQSSEGATLYINLSPCKNCSKLILQSGIKRVVYSKQHSCYEGIIFLKQQGVECNFLNIE